MHKYLIKSKVLAKLSESCFIEELSSKHVVVACNGSFVGNRNRSLRFSLVTVCQINMGCGSLGFNERNYTKFFRQIIPKVYY